MKPAPPVTRIMASCSFILGTGRLDIFSLSPPPQPSPTRGEGALLLPPPLWGRGGGPRPPSPLVGGGGGGGDRGSPPPCGGGWGWGGPRLPPPLWGRVGVGGNCTQFNRAQYMQHYSAVMRSEVRSRSAVHRG